MARSRFILLALFILPRSFVMALKPVGVAGAASAVTSGDDIATTTQHHAPSGSECPLLNSNNHVFRLPPEFFSDGKENFPGAGRQSRRASRRTSLVNHLT
jgi:hypothetical protein